MFKLNQVLSHVPLRKVTEAAQSYCAFAVVDVSEKMLANLQVMKSFSRTQMQIMLQLPFQFADQLVRDSVNSSEVLQFQAKMVRQLVSLYTDLFLALRQDLANAALQYLVDSLVLASGSGLGLDEFPKAREALQDLIQ